MITKIFTSFSKKERLTFIAIFFVFLVTSILFIARFVSEETKLVPIDSGEYIEGAITQPSFVNPIYASANNSDNDISKLVFADLKILSENIQPNANGTEYDIRLKDNLKWQDGQALTADDVIFTIKTIQDQDSNSPLASSWKGVQVLRLSELELRIDIPAPYVFFQNTLTSLQPIPKHLFENIPVSNIRLSNYNLEPIGSGPFKFSGFDKRRDGFITKYTLKRDSNYFGDKPHIESFTFKFYSSQDEVIKAFNSGDVDGLSVNTQKDIDKISIPHETFALDMPRYYAIFFNPEVNPLFNDKTVRQALEMATDKDSISKAIFGNNATPLNQPLLSDTIPQFNSQYSIDNANKLLDANGWHLNSDGIREKQNGNSVSRLEFVLTVYPSQSIIDATQLLQGQWSKIGAKIHVYDASSDNFNESVIKTRNYEMLIFGNFYTENIDPYSFWHSSQKFYPGLNLSLYKNTLADQTIEKIRTESNLNQRTALVNSLGSEIYQDQPAIFLYAPKYIYISTKLLKGFSQSYLYSPSDRFDSIANWYTHTMRILK